MTNATVLNLTVDAGTTLQVEFTVKEDSVTPVNLTGWQARMYVRAAYNQPGSPLITFTSSPADGLVIDPLVGKITLTINPGDTDPIKAPKNGRTLYYDLEVFDTSGIVYRPFQGEFKLYPQITTGP